ncbi:MAG: polysaccharide deacetylase family protein, partial [Chloroflexi bacterium]|nr:polysaccharide deacetylase family protein [Chloroflexota bacterium]
ITHLIVMPVPILMYHAVHERRSMISISPDLFAWQMQWLYERQFRVRPLREVIPLIHSGASLPPRTIVLTFDDGLTSVYEHAFPIMQRYQFTATIFLISNYMGQKNNWPSQPTNIAEFSVMTWEQAQEMQVAGFDFGAHTATHPKLDLISPEAAVTEIVTSKTVIEERLRQPVDLFAFPYGRYNQSTLETIRQQFSGACTTHMDAASKQNHPLELPRFDTFYLQSPTLFRHLTNPLLQQYLKLRGFIRDKRQHI